MHRITSRLSCDSALRKSLAFFAFSSIVSSSPDGTGSFRRGRDINVSRRLPRGLEKTARSGKVKPMGFAFFSGARAGNSIRRLEPEVGIPLWRVRRQTSRPQGTDNALAEPECQQPVDRAQLEIGRAHV